MLWNCCSKASIQHAQNGPSTQLIKATSCVERLNATIKAEELSYLSIYQGMVQAWVAHFVTPLKCRYDEWDWWVMNQKAHNKHNSPNKHHYYGGEATNPSSRVILMNPCRLRGGWPCAYLFSCHHQRILFHSLNVEINLFMSTSSWIEFGLVHRRQWWPKRRPLLSAAANKVRTSR